jgi:hypothetical protein
MGTLTFEPLISPALWAALAVLAVPLLAWYARSRPAEMRRLRWAGIIGLMGAGLAGVLLILLNPTWVEQVPPPAGKPRLTLLVDASASMGTADLPGAQSRYQEAARLAAEMESGLHGEFDVQTRVFSAAAGKEKGSGSFSRNGPEGAAQKINLTPFPPLAGLRPEGLVTDLAAAISSATGEDRPQGQAVVLLSDGNHNAGGGVGPVLEAARLARAMAAPVYCRTLGGAAEVRDMALELVTPQEVAFVGQRVFIEARITHQGLAGGHTSVALFEGGKELARQDVALLPGTPVGVQFEVSRPAKGLARYEVKADAVPGEATAGNNEAVFLLRTVDEPIHILLLEGKPYWDGKFLMRTLAADPLAELDCIVRVADGRLVRQTLGAQRAAASQPTAASVASANAGPAAASAARLEKWSVVTDASQVLAKPEALRQYQIVVLGRDADVFLTEAGLSNLRDWVAREGGALMCYRGSPVAQVTGRLANILPVEWTAGRELRFHVKLTPRGRELRWLPDAGDAQVAGLGALPTLATVSQVGRTKPLAAVLATAVFADGKQEAPVVTWQPYGTGRAVVIEGAGMWRWAFLPPDQQQNDALYGTLWHSMLRWLVSGGGLLPGEKLALRSEKACFSTQEQATATLQVRESVGVVPSAVELVAEGESQGLLRRRFVPTVLRDEPGTYRVTFGKLPAGHYRARVVALDTPGTRSVGPSAPGLRPVGVSRADGAAGDPAGEAMFDVVNSLDEQLDVKARPELMVRIAEQSGGVVLADASPGEIAGRFREHAAANRPPRVHRLTAWDRWWVMLSVFGVWGGAWALRRSGGLI